MYHVLVARKPLKYLRDLSEEYKEAVKTKLKELENSPIQHGSIHLTGRDRCFRLRIGPFRVQYQVIEQDKVVLVYKISRRDETTYK